MAYVGINQSKRENVWFLDSGCSNHMCGNKEWFFDLDEKFRQSVKLGDNSRMMAMGKGNVKLHINGLTQMSANMMFVVLAFVISPTSTCLQATSEYNTQLWHCWYGHLNFKGLRTLLYKEMVRGLPMFKASSKVCDYCMVGKQHREALPKKSMWRASKKLQLEIGDVICCLRTDRGGEFTSLKFNNFCSMNEVNR
ncbi:unnamed protein product [Prunus armeniaca]